MIYWIELPLEVAEIVIWTAVAVRKSWAIAPEDEEEPEVLGTFTVILELDDAPVSLGGGTVDRTHITISKQ